MKYFNLKRKTYQNYLRPISRNFKSQESTEWYFSNPESK
jgi:hypothetical protein